MGPQWWEHAEKHGGKFSKTIKQMVVEWEDKNNLVRAITCGFMFFYTLISITRNQLYTDEMVGNVLFGTCG